MRKKISDTYVYDLFNLDKTVSKIISVNSRLDLNVLDKSIVDTINHEFRFKINFPTKNRILEDIKNNKMVFVDIPEIYLPAWSIAKGTTIDKTVVNLFGKIKIKNKELVPFNVREVFAIAQIGYVVRSFYENERKILYNISITIDMMTIYVRLFSKILDILYSIETQPLYAAQTKFMLAKFFLIYVMEREDNEQTEIIAFKTVNEASSLENIKNSLKHLDATTYESLPNLINGLSQNIVFLKDLNIITFLRKVILTYSEKSVLMLENLNFFIAFILSNSIQGNYLKDYVIDSAVGKNGMSMYNTFVDLTK